MRQSATTRGDTVDDRGPLPLTLFVSACDKTETPTSSTDTTTTASTVAEPTITEEFVGTVPVGGSRFYSFEVVANGTVNVTLASMGGAGVPSTCRISESRRAV